MAAVQRRYGPDIVGPWGVLQPLADGVKLIFKEIIYPRKANKILFIFAPISSFVIALTFWSIVPFNYFDRAIDSSLGVLYFIFISSIGVYSMFLAGWSSNSKYAYLGAIRMCAQMVSYEIVMGLSILCVLILSGSLSFIDIVCVQAKTVLFIFPLLPMGLIFFISSVCETNRAPFDLGEGESELSSGFNIEYSGILFALFFLGEYSNIVLICVVFTIFFLGVEEVCSVYRYCLYSHWVLKL
jgi:NADH-quinone oxidoreductase subunit H